MRALIFLEMEVLCSGFNVMFPKSQNGRILPNKLHFEKLIPLFFANIKSWRRESVLIFVCFGLFSEIWSFYGFYPITAAKAYFTVHFPKF